MSALPPTSVCQHTAPTKRVLSVLRLGLVAAWVAACSTTGALPEASLENALASSESDPGVLRVQLAFGDGADLDLFVSDPHAETVYFGNSPSASGGVLEEDRRCGDPAPRVETVRFEQPLPGRYRVGVDHAGDCGDGRPEPFVVEVSHEARRTLQRGVVEPGRFEVVVLEFQVGTREAQ